MTLEFAGAPIEFEAIKDSGGFMKRTWERRDVLKAAAGGSALALLGAGMVQAQEKEVPAMILKNGKFTTLDSSRASATAVAIAGGRFTAVGDDKEIMKLAGPKTQVVDLGGRRVIPGLMDSHTHPDPRGP